jgi:hypothetical protein
MSLEKLQITLNPGGTTREYDIFPLQEVTITSRKEAFSIAPPGLSSSENILLGVSGMQADISIDATIWDNGTDRANGTAPTGQFTNDTVVTVGEQITYLEDYIHDPGFSASWTLDHLTGAAFNDDDVFVESIEPTVLSQDSPKWKPVRMTLRRGQSVG